MKRLRGREAQRQPIARLDQGSRRRGSFKGTQADPPRWRDEMKAKSSTGKSSASKPAGRHN
jgi:hypothetical protein